MDKSVPGCGKSTIKIEIQANFDLLKATRNPMWAMESSRTLGQSLTLYVLAVSENSLAFTLNMIGSTDKETKMNGLNFNLF